MINGFVFVSQSMFTYGGNEACQAESFVVLNTEIDLSQHFQNK